MEDKESIVQGVEKCSGFREGGEWFLCALGPCFQTTEGKFFIRKGTSLRPPCIPEWRKIKTWEIPEQIRSQLPSINKT